MSNVDKILEGIKNGSITNVAILSGAGMSCAAGIPDFRSAGGLYDSLNPALLTASEEEKKALRDDPTNVVNIEMFQHNQFPHLEVRRAFILGTAELKWKATLGHFFVKVLNERGLLRRLYTQNIDGLDFQLGIPREKIVNVHGSIGEIYCEFCKQAHNRDEFVAAVRSNIKNIYDPTDPTAPAESSNILCNACGRAGVKPNTVMYGCPLPDIVWSSAEQDFPDNIDLVIVIGTSLTIHPACDLVNKVRPGTPRLVINREEVGRNLGLDFSPSSGRDGFAEGDIDASVLRLASQLGWLGDLAVHKDKMCPGSAAALEEAISSGSNAFEVDDAGESDEVFTELQSHCLKVVEDVGKNAAINYLQKIIADIEAGSKGLPTSSGAASPKRKQARK